MLENYVNLLISCFIMFHLCFTVTSSINAAIGASHRHNHGCMDEGGDKSNVSANLWGRGFPPVYQFQLTSLMYICI